MTFGSHLRTLPGCLSFRKRNAENFKWPVQVTQLGRVGVWDSNPDDVIIARVHDLNLDGLVESLRSQSR